MQVSLVYTAERYSECTQNILILSMDTSHWHILFVHNMWIPEVYTNCNQMNYTKWYFFGVKQTCLAGKYSTAGSTTCLDCPAGKSCGAGTETPTDCNAGHYSLVGAATCTPCPIGSMCTAKDQGPTLCQEGYYTSSTGNPQFLSCIVEIITCPPQVIRHPCHAMQRLLQVIHR